MATFCSDVFLSAWGAPAWRRALAAAAILAACGGCGAPQMTGVHFGGDLEASDLNYPPRNPRPLQRVQIEGVLSPALQARLSAHYQTDGSRGCQSAPSFTAGAVEGVVGPSTVSVALPLTRQAGRYSSSFEMDAFSPGGCHWRFAYVSVELAKAGRVSLSNPVARVREGAYAGRPDTDWGNARDTPVVLHCWFSALRGDGPTRQSNACIEPPGWPHPEKREHYLTAHSRRMAANFIDEESTPTPP